MSNLTIIFPTHNCVIKQQTTENLYIFIAFKIFTYLFDFYYINKFSKKNICFSYEKVFNLNYFPPFLLFKQKIVNFHSAIFILI